MLNMKKSLKLLFICIISIAVCLMIMSCDSPVTKDLFSYANTPFTATVNGTCNGLAFSAEVFCAKSAMTSNGGIVLCARFTSPNSLSGIVVTLMSTGEVAARLANSAIDTETARGLSELFLPLIPSESYSSVERDGDRTICHLPHGEGERAYTFSSDILYPLTISDSKLHLDIIDFKTK